MAMAPPVENGEMSTSEDAMASAATIPGVDEPERKSIFRGLLAFAGTMTVVGPLVAWTFLVAGPQWLGI